ncbi:hypothetical protein GCM10018771_19770 [Streptomyces cellulosae]|nr:hypothetical protein GCM10018771_19770 [Streptomyces cellulosae]
MRAVVTTPRTADTHRLVELPDPKPAQGQALVEVLSVGLDGTDVGIARGGYGEAPDGEDELRAYDDPAVDGALLMLPLVGFIDGTRPAQTATIDAILDHLAPPSGPHQPSLLWRYPPATPRSSPDGLPGAEGAFILCSFWLVEALTLAGRPARAERLFTALCDLAQPLGSLAEQIDPATGEQLGNTPQAFTHIGLINAALRLAGTTAKGSRRPPPPTPQAHEKEAGKHGALRRDHGRLGPRETQVFCPDGDL